jgi:DNA invertase Pin-like site-specific DNA recombinase
MVQETIINDIRKTDCELISVCEGEDLLSDEPTRQLVRQMMGAIAQYEKSMIVQKLKVARERKKIKDGKCEGRKSYIEAAPHIVKEIKRLRRKSKGIDKRKSYNGIAEDLNRKGLKTLMGKDFTAGMVKHILATS